MPGNYTLSLAGNWAKEQIRNSLTLSAGHEQLLQEHYDAGARYALLMLFGSYGGFDGVYLAGQRNPGEVERVLDMAADFAADWRACLEDVSYPEPVAYRLYEPGDRMGPVFGQRCRLHRSRH